ncbi:MAG: hypothetical protein LLF89_04320 [Spirochaetaceae bacterium]|nr:hypothetical protein [Spirochaetaceae bacterium]
MVITIAVLWSVSIGAALYAGYRWGSKVKEKVLSEAREITDKVKDEISDVADSIKKKAGE